MHDIPEEIRRVLPASVLDYPRVEAEPAAASAARESAQQEVNTFGWDTVFAIPVKHANRAIRDQKSSPAGFRYEFPGGQLAAEGSFGDWQIHPGGDGPNIWLALPIRDAKVFYPEGGERKQKSYQNLTAIVQFKLNFLPHTARQKDSSEGIPHNLVVRDSSGDPSDPVASIVDMLPHKDKKSIPDYIIESAITKWCCENVGQFGHVFATVNLNERIDTEEWSFCKPSYTSYAYIEKQTVDESCLAVLCMTGDRKPASNIQQVSPFVIPDGSEAGFLISRKRFLKDLVLPSIPLHWKKAKLSQFRISEDDRSLELKPTETIELPECKHKGKRYTPKLKSFSMEVEGKLVIFESYTEVKLAPGITGWCSTKHWYRIELGHNKNGQTLIYKEDRKSVHKHDFYEAEIIKELEIWILILGAVAAIIVGILTGGAGFLIAALIVGLLVGAVIGYTAINELSNKDTTPALDLLAFNSTQPIQWAGGKEFKLDFASLNNAFQLGGNPGFA